MNVIAYALMAYGITAVISYAVIGVIVLLNKVMSSSTETMSSSTEAMARSAN